MSCSFVLGSLIVLCKIEYETEIPVAAVPLVPDLEIKAKRYPPFFDISQSALVAAGGGRKGLLVFSFDPSNTTKSFKLETADFGTTHFYGPLSTRRKTASKYWWDYEVVSGKTPLSSRTLQRTEENLNAKVMPDGSIDFHLHGAIPIPFMPYTVYNPTYWLKSAIDGAFTIKFAKLGNHTQLEINGTHDGFPKHMIRLNGKDIYVHDPLITGDDPLSLMGEMEIKTMVKCII
jgi:hypothetical protein